MDEDDQRTGYDYAKPVHQLVLSIFKGENFAVKGSGQSAFIKAKCADLKPGKILESGITKLLPSNSEPEFHSQLAWSVSRRQLKELRSNRSIIRIACLLVDERTSKETEVGYVVINVKDAIAFPKAKDVLMEVDPSKAKSCQLLGTKESWRPLQPKLNMILHLEDLDTKGHRSKNKGRLNGIDQEIVQRPLKIEPENIEVPPPIINAAQLSQTKLQQNHEESGKFLWTVHANEGYFQLGSPADQDDLYILNTTVIAANYFHKLWDGRSPPKEQKEYFWQVKYAAYGCEIASETFMLATGDSSRRTFIGDKATARIRANGVVFYDYLQETCLEFCVMRYQLEEDNKLSRGEVMGFCYADLKDLSGPDRDRDEFRVCMEVVSEWGTSRALSVTEKPEVRVLFSLKAFPGYFSQINDGTRLELDANDIPINPNNVPEIENGLNGQGSINEHDDTATATKPPVPAGPVEIEDDVDMPDSADVEISDAANSSNVRRLLLFEEENEENLDNNISDNETSPGTLSSLPSSPKRNHARAAFSKKPTTAKVSEHEESDSDFASNKESLSKLMPVAGQYILDIELSKFWLKSSHILERTFVLSYNHQPIGIEEPVDCYSQRLSSESQDSRQGFVLLNNTYSKTISIRKYSEKLINEPLTIEFYKLIDDGQKSRRFATAMIPFGRIFAEKEQDYGRIFKDNVDILRSNNSKIGTLIFSIKLRNVLDSFAKPKQSAFFPPRLARDDELAVAQHKKFLSSDKYLKDLEHMDKITNEMREWTRTQEEIHRKQKEEKETAYLRILSEEANKRDSEREAILTKKVADLDKKEKELSRQKRQTDEKEQKLNQLEAEIRDKLRELNLQQQDIEHHAGLNKRRLEEDFNIKLDSLTRQVQNYKDENEKLKTKLMILEKKLETKDAEIDKLIDLKREQPDSCLLERVRTLEQNNKMLTSQLKDTNSRKEQYKKQVMAVCQKVQQLQAEKDKQLRDVNDSLRLQILATKEHKELKKERKAVHEISQTIKALQKETIPMPTEKVRLPYESKLGRGEGDQRGNRPEGRAASSSKDKEIQRLQEKRKQLLSTGAYTQFDLVIKELEKKMICLSQE